MTGVQHIANALGIIEKLTPGGTPSASQVTRYVIVLNELLQSYTARGFLGTSFSGNVATQTAVSNYNSGGTDDITFPVGWDAMIDYALALRICGTEGKGSMIEWLTAMVEATEKGALHA